MAAEQEKIKWTARQWKRNGMIAVLLLLPSLFTLLSYCFVLKSSGERETVEMKEYRYHFAMITEHAGTPFWNEVYERAVQEAKAYDAFVELVGDGLVERLSIEDSVDMAVYENVDGILLQPSEGDAMQEVIDKAESHGIPVITLQKDAPYSKRRGFVGINDYFLGQEYGKRVLKIADRGICLVTVLIPGATFNKTSQAWFCSGLENTLQDETVRLDIRVIRDDNGLNNAEDIIHSMVEGYTPCPDLIICLDSVITQTAYQVIADKGLSGVIPIIGSDVSDTILDGIEQGGIDSAITVDAGKLGALGVSALMSYKQHRLVSYYTEVGTEVVDRLSLPAYREVAEDEKG